MDLNNLVEHISEVNKMIAVKHHTYNTRLADNARNLGGRWNAVNKTWEFDSMVADKAKELDALYNTDLVIVEITAREEIHAGRKSADFCGYPIARAVDRDSSAKLGDGVAMINGSISSGGSWKNWHTCIGDGSIFRLKVARPLLEATQNKIKNWEIKILETAVNEE